MTNAELNAMPWTASLMITDELFVWLASRKEAPLAIDIESCRARPVEVLRRRPIRRARLSLEISAPNGSSARRKVAAGSRGGSGGRQIRGEMDKVAQHALATAHAV